MTKSLDRFTSSHSLGVKRKMSVSRKNEMFFNAMDSPDIFPLSSSVSF